MDFSIHVQSLELKNVESKDSLLYRKSKKLLRFFETTCIVNI